jgi:hypothetical protein
MSRSHSHVTQTSHTLLLGGTRRCVCAQGLLNHFLQPWFVIITRTTLESRPTDIICYYYTNTGTLESLPTAIICCYYRNTTSFKSLPTAIIYYYRRTGLWNYLHKEYEKVLTEVEINPITILSQAQNINSEATLPFISGEKISLLKHSVKDTSCQIHGKVMKWIQFI